MTDTELLNLLLEKEGMTYDDYLDNYNNNASGAVTGICSNCHAISMDCEPDARDMDCFHCNYQGTVKSGFILMEVI